MSKRYPVTITPLKPAVCLVVASLAVALRAEARDQRVAVQRQRDRYGNHGLHIVLEDKRVPYDGVQLERARTVELTPHVGPRVVLTDEFRAHFEPALPVGEPR